jgi:acetate---CoA ligase (ADP-forming)
MSERKRDLGLLFNPASVAVVGASADPGRVGGRVLANLRRHHYTGEVFVVDRGSAATGIGGALPTIEALPAIPDVAILAVSAGRCPAAVDALGKLGTRNAVVLAGGFEESGSAGAALAKRLCEVAEHHQMNLVGPNSQGIWSLPANLVMAFGSETSRPNLVRGPVAVISQSGSLAGAVATQLQNVGVGISYLISAGNETDLCLADYLEHLLETGDVRVAACYVEAVRDGPRLIRTLARACELGVDVVILRAGLSDSARRATRSHTGRMLSSAKVLDDVCRQQGSVTVGSVHQLVEACRVLSLSPVRLPPEPRIGMIGISGGMLALMSDSCDRHHLTLPRLEEQTEAALKAILPSFSTPTNPVDLTGAILERPELLPEAVRAVGKDSLIDAVVVGLDNRGYDRVSELRDLGGPGQHRKPIIEVLWHAPPSRDWTMERELAAAAILVVDEPAEVGAQLAWLSKRRPAGHTLEGAATRIAALGELTNWAVQRQLLESLGFRVPAAVLIQEPAEISQALLDRLGYPIVVKPVPNAVQHKTDLGLVKVDLWTLDAVTGAARDIRDRLPPAIPLLVQAQVAGVEVLIAARSDPDWGPVLTIGAGGVRAETLDDSVSFSMPCAAEYVALGLTSLRTGRILAGHRGGQPADQAALLACAGRLQEFYLANQALLRVIELNPVIVAPEGSGVFAVDLLVD